MKISTDIPRTQREQVPSQKDLGIGDRKGLARHLLSRLLLFFHVVIQKCTPFTFQLNTFFFSGFG